MYNMKLLKLLQKKSLSSLKTVQKKITFLSKPKNASKVIFLLGFLIVLYLVHRFFLSKEGFDTLAEDFEDKVAAKKSVVLFYADWCGHCKNFMSTWDDASKELNDSQSNVQYMKVDCGKPTENKAHEDIMKKYEIRGYPTILVFENGSSTEFKGDRTLEGLRSVL